MSNFLEIKMVVNLEYKGEKSEATLRIFSSCEALAFGRGTRNFYVGGPSSIHRGFSTMDLSDVPIYPTYCNIHGYAPDSLPEVSSLEISQIDLANPPMFVSPPSHNNDTTRLLGVRVMEEYRIKKDAKLFALASFYGHVLVRPSESHPSYDVFYDVDPDTTNGTIPNGAGPWYYEPFEFFVFEPPRITEKS